MSERSEVAPIVRGTGLVAALAVMPSTPVAAVETNISAGVDFSYQPKNVVTMVLIGGALPAAEQQPYQYEPRTALGRKLLALRRAHSAKGEKLLNWAEIDKEVRQRRGGVPDE